MDTILVLAHTEADGSLAKPAQEAVGAAAGLQRELGATLIVGLYGAQVQRAADSLANCGGQRFLAVEGEAFSQPRYATDAAACEALVLASGATIVITAQTSRAARVMAGVAHRLHGAVDTHVTNVATTAGSLQVSRWFYRQRIEGSLARSARPWILLLDPGSHAPGSHEQWVGEAGPVKLEAVAVNVTDALKRTVIQGFVIPPADQQTIRPDASLLFVAGAGWTKKQRDGQPHVPEAETIIQAFLQNSQASLGSSKSLVDLSGENQAALRFLSHLNQVGQTGASPRHAKGLATCCHGEEPHTVGWRFIGERRAINLDPGCGWARGKADVLYVADAFEVMTKVNALLASK
jgi:electron transfer flavoprotein alpha subunit